ncbi:MAG: SDR family oxidoreductase [Ktedonobacterales bacterium]|nr:SDR family oxidoreductase [Ktedonobacterales bacterium]
MMDSILVTGATGNVGAAVMRGLAAAGVPARAAVRDVADVRHAGHDAVRFDFAQPETFAPALAGVKQVFLMRPPALSDTKRYINPFIDAARAAGVEQIVFLSLLGAEKIRVVPHRRVEQYLETSGVGWTFLRPSFFMQNLTTTHLHEIRDDNRIAVPAGNGRTSFIDGDDVAAVAVTTLTTPGHGGHAYDLTGSEALTYTQVAAEMTEVLGRRITYTHPSLLTFARGMHAQGQPTSFIVVTAAIYTTARLGLAATITPALADLLGRAPTTMQQFIVSQRATLTPTELLP